MKKIFILLFFLLAPSFAAAAPGDSCKKSLMRTVASDILKIADLYDAVPAETRARLFGAIETAKEPEIDGVLRFYLKY